MNIRRNKNLSLGELACATSCLETVFLSFLHTRVTSEKSCLFEKGTIFFFVNSEKCSCNTVSDSACLTGNTAAGNCADDVKFALCICNCEGLTNDELQCIKSEVIVNIAFIDGDNTCTGENANTSY